MNGIFLGLGTNLGDRNQNLEKALNMLEQQVGPIVKRSSIYETEAWGKTDQPDFLNMVIQIDTKLTPHQLLETCLTIETEIGRERFEKWGPRIIDIDILYYNNEVINEEDLKIPHPFIEEREFVLKPLKEITDEL